MKNSEDLFLALVRAGLWERSVQLPEYSDTSFKEIYRLAEEQAVVGVVAAGLEYATSLKITRETVLSFVGNALQIEQRNRTMNDFIVRLIERLRKNNINALLVKGQGIAQCYERPLWRMSGDIDLFINEGEFEKAIEVSNTLADHFGPNRPGIKHLSMFVDKWEIELHGTLHSLLCREIDRELDSIQRDTFDNNKYRIWVYNNTEIRIPEPNNDLIFVFVHILQHLFGGGVGIRQICDLCRFLWKYNDYLDNDILLLRLRRMKLLTEWKVLGCVCVKYLGLPEYAYPLYDNRYEYKAKWVLEFVIKCGNSGHNKDSSYLLKHGALIRRVISFWRQFKDNFVLLFVFPHDSCKFFAYYIYRKLH